MKITVSKYDFRRPDQDRADVATHEAPALHVSYERGGVDEEPMLVVHLLSDETGDEGRRTLVKEGNRPYVRGHMQRYGFEYPARTHTFMIET